MLVVATGSFEVPGTPQREIHKLGPSPPRGSEDLNCTGWAGPGCMRGRCLGAQHGSEPRDEPPAAPRLQAQPMGHPQGMPRARCLSAPQPQPACTIQALGLNLDIDISNREGSVVGHKEKRKALF